MKKFFVIFTVVGIISLAGCSSFRAITGTGGDCALNDLPYPRPEPDSNGKLERDFSSFASALEDYTSEQVAAREALTRS